MSLFLYIILYYLKQNIQMELYTLNLKNYKRAYRRAMIITVLVIVCSIIFVKTGYYALELFYSARTIYKPVIYLMIAGSFFSGWIYKRRIKQLDNIAEFETKAATHEKIYKARVFGGMLICCGACFVYVVTTHNIFLYLSIFDLVIYLLMFPNKMIIQKELKTEDIIFI